MPLSGQELGELHEAIVEAFRCEDLEKLCLFNLEIDLDAIAGGENYSHIVLNLLKWAKKDEAQLRALVTAAYEARSDHPKLRQICEKLSPLSTPTRSTPPRAIDELAPFNFDLIDELAPFNFDLTELIRECMKKLLDQRGLVGLAVPCSADAFLPNFCQRLKSRLGRSNVDLRQPLSLQPIANSVTTAVNRIQRYEAALQSGDVICPVRIAKCRAGSDVPDQFWQQLQSHFQGEFQHRLIVVMVGDESCVFPQDAMLLDAPRFDKEHADDWISNIARKLGWGDVTDIWRQKMIDRCPHDEYPTELLDISLVYYHLDATRGLLQQKPPLTADKFLEQLD